MYKDPFGQSNAWDAPNGWGWRDNRLKKPALPSAYPEASVLPFGGMMTPDATFEGLGGESRDTRDSGSSVSSNYRESMEGSVKDVGKEAFGRGVKTALTGLAMSAPADAIAGGALKSAANPAGLASSVVDGAWSAAGYKPETLSLDKPVTGNRVVGSAVKTGLPMALGFIPGIGPALGMMTSLVASPFAEAVQDGLGTRDMEEERDAIEDSNLDYSAKRSALSGLMHTRAGFAVDRPKQGTGAIRAATMDELLAKIAVDPSFQSAASVEKNVPGYNFTQSQMDTAYAKHNSGNMGMTSSDMEAAQAARDQEARDLGVHSSQTGGSGPDTAAGSRIICSELVRQGLIPDEERRLETWHTLKHKSKTSIRGYHVWAKPVVEAMKKSNRVTRFWHWVMKHRNNEIKRIMKGEGPHDFIGKALRAVLEPFSFVVGMCVSVDPVDKRFNRGAREARAKAQ